MPKVPTFPHYFIGRDGHQPSRRGGQRALDVHSLLKVNKGIKIHDTFQKSEKG